MMNLVIIGASGLAREVYDIAMTCYGKDPDFKVKGFISNDPIDKNPEKYPPYLGLLEDYTICKDDVFFCAIGSPRIKKKCVHQILEKGGTFINIIPEGVYISPLAKIGSGVCIKFGTVVSPDAEIGDYTFIQSNCVIGHDVKIGSFCQINSFCFFAGGSKVQDMATINAGAKIVQNVTIGENATVGVGSIVIRNVKPNTTVFGNPAKKLEI